MESKAVGQARRILLVEDEHLVAMAERQSLESAGYTVSVASSGEQAVRRVQRSTDIDLILMDIDLGEGIDGPEAALQILLMESIPIVFLTSHTKPEIVARVEEITSYGYIVKGAGPTVMLAAVKMAFQLWDAHQSLEQIHAEKKKQNDYMRRILSLDPTSYLAVTEDGYISDVNQAYCRTTGYWPGELIGRHVSELDADQDHVGALKHIGGMLDGRMHQFSARHIRKDGTTVPLEISVQRIETEDGNRLIAFCRDLSREPELAPQPATEADQHYLQTELYELVRTDPAIFRFLRESSLDGLWYWDLENQEQEWMDNRFWELLGFDPAEKSHSPSEWQDLIHTDDLAVALDNFTKHLHDPNHSYDQVVRYSHRDGGTVYVRCRGMAIRDSSGKPLRMLGVHNDITRMMQALENERLLHRELNHRVKNNLAIVHSLISLKEMESEGRLDLADIRHQVETIRLVHQTLQSEDRTGSVQASTYLEAILGSVFDSEVEYQVLGDSPDLSTTVAVPLGLVVNEIATNAVKHGFADEAVRRFRVTLTPLPGEADRVHVHIWSSGRPFPANVDPSSSPTLGLQLIYSLVEELGSEITLTRQPSPTFEFDVADLPVDAHRLTKAAL